MFYLRFNFKTGHAEIISTPPPLEWGEFGRLDISGLSQVAQEALLKAHPPARVHHPAMILAADNCE